MKLKQQTVYIPTKNRGGTFEICSFGTEPDATDWTIPVTNAEVSEGYFLSKDELIDALQTAFDYGVQKAQMGDLVPNRTTFINNMLAP